MAQIPNPNRLPPQYDTSVYKNVSVGPRLLYTFEQQFGVPVDGGNPLLRDLSPFNIRLIPPQNILANDRTYSKAAATYITSIGSVANSNNSSKNDPFANAAKRARDQREIAKSSTATASSSLPSSFSTIFSDLPNQRQVRLADAYTALDLRNQANAMASVPPLTLLVNPTSMEVSFSNIQSFTNRGRNGFLFQRWGEQQPTISFSGTTGAFIAGSDPSLGGSQQRTLVPSGVQFASRRNSAAWQNFLSLFHFYKSNGYIYDTIGKTEAHLSIGTIAIDYDQFTYLGHIDSLEYSFDESRPHRVEWNMSFVCSRIIDTATGEQRASFDLLRDATGILRNFGVTSDPGGDIPVVAPLSAPTPSPSYPSRSVPTSRTAGGATVGVSISPSGVSTSVPPSVGQLFSQLPLDLLTPGG